MCEECRRRFVATVVADVAAQGYSRVGGVGYTLEEDAAKSVVYYAIQLWDLMSLAVGGFDHGGDGDEYSRGGSGRDGWIGDC